MWIKPFKFVLVVLAFAGCDTPTVGFSYEKTQKLRVGENEFLVYYNDEQAQAVRLNNQTFGGLKGALDDGATAIETVTGCRIKSLHPKSDTVLTRASLRC
ncbi:hypothetical protein [Roseobacter sp. N2S]|uniref:hypothetical protein n=1 Tax=Roseobacter sp. N2S TaxID=2663844 RepID=UPI002855EA2A|nr:hypothetical protein [Roseobacter sp. N2S]MDR6264318.1 hypothetical protein [Roseobacter sp. N2S]